MTAKRKEANITIPLVNAAAPRDLSACATPGTRSYPRAADLASDGAWAAWLQETLAAVLRPAAVAGAMSLAACSLAQGSDAPPLPPPPLAVAPEAPPCEIPQAPMGHTTTSVGASAPPATTYATALVPLGSPQNPVVAPQTPVVSDPDPDPRRDPRPRHNPPPPPPDPRPMPGGIRPVQFPPPNIQHRTAGAPVAVQPGVDS